MNKQLSILIHYLWLGAGIYKNLKGSAAVLPLWAAVGFFRIHLPNPIWAAVAATAEVKRNGIKELRNPSKFSKQIWAEGNTALMLLFRCEQTGAHAVAAA